MDSTSVIFFLSVVFIVDFNGDSSLAGGTSPLFTDIPLGLIVDFTLSLLKSIFLGSIEFSSYFTMTLLGD
jgi:hypothetical protein